MELEHIRIFCCGVCIYIKFLRIIVLFRGSLLGSLFPETKNEAQPDKRTYAYEQQSYSICILEEHSVGITR